VDGYDAGFANVYNENRNQKCRDKIDQYNRTWFIAGCESVEGNTWESHKKITGD
jgi:hypothetical protein